MLFSETTGPSLTIFCMKAFMCIKMKICLYDAGHMTKMAAMLIYGENPSKFFSTGKTWVVASGTSDHYSLFKIKTGVTLFYFMARSNLVI